MIKQRTGLNDCIQKCLQTVYILQTSNQSAIAIDKKEKMTDKIVFAEQDPQMTGLIFNALQIMVDNVRQLIITDS